jgi:hypothetical protein
MQTMKPRDLLESTLYLDKDFIADLYEVVSGQSPSTMITKNQSKKAGAAIPVFSAEVSAQEIRSFPVSTFSMLSTTLQSLKEEAVLDAGTFKSGMTSKYGWIEGELTVFKVSSTVQRHETGVSETLAEGEFFQLRQKSGVDLALITTPEYFSFGLNNFLKMQKTLLKEMSLPVKAYIRVMAAQSHTRQWIAVPLVILERRDA